MNPYLVRTMTGLFECNTSRAILPKVSLASANVSAFTSEIQTVVLTGARRPLRVHPLTMMEDSVSHLFRVARDVFRICRRIICIS